MSNKSKTYEKSPPKSLSGLSDDRWCKYRDIILGILKGLTNLE